ncbi:hypothetical protein DRQ09_02550 [candidate division KSB1 bacterium]|nr:MAG: hypothetical protein DRQ09_02550 [candidate division KSB1 bacterium]
MAEYDNLAEYYDWEWKNLIQDIPLIVELAKNAGSPVLELACGTGRVTFPVAESGIEIYGIDNSSLMLDYARKKLAQYPDDVKNNVKLIQGNMKDFCLNKRFNFIFISFNSFLLLYKKEDQEQCLNTVRKHLDDNGIFYIDVYSPRFEFCAEEKSPIRFLQHFYIPDTKKVVLQWEYVERNMAEQISEIDFLYEEYDKNGNLTRKARHLTMGIVFRFEMQFMLEKNGFEVIEFYGNYDKKRFDTKSPQMIFICKKKF